MSAELGGLFNGTTGLELAKVCNSYISKKKKLMAKDYETLKNKKRQYDRRYNVIEAANCAIIMSAIFPFSISAAMGVTLPLLPAEKVLKSFNNKITAWIAATVTFVTLEILATGSIFAVTVPVCMVYAKTIEKLKKNYGTMPDEDNRKLRELKQNIKDENSFISHTKRTKFLPCIKNIMTLFAKDAPFLIMPNERDGEKTDSPLLSLPNEMQYEILKLGMPTALEILKLVAEKNNNPPPQITYARPKEAGEDLMFI